MILFRTEFGYPISFLIIQVQPGSKIGGVVLLQNRGDDLLDDWSSNRMIRPLSFSHLPLLELLRMDLIPAEIVKWSRNVNCPGVYLDLEIHVCGVNLSPTWIRPRSENGMSLFLLAIYYSGVRHLLGNYLQPKAFADIGGSRLRRSAPKLDPHWHPRTPDLPKLKDLTQIR